MLPIVSGVLCLLCYALLCVHSSFAIILKRKRELVALLLSPHFIKKRKEDIVIASVRPSVRYAISQTVGQNSTKGVHALRGYFGPLQSQKLKVAFHQFNLIGLLEE